MASSENVRITDLPSEALWKIARELYARTIPTYGWELKRLAFSLLTLRKVCRAFREEFGNPDEWRELYKQQFEYRQTHMFKRKMDFVQYMMRPFKDEDGDPTEKAGVTIGESYSSFVWRRRFVIVHKRCWRKAFVERCFASCPGCSEFKEFTERWSYFCHPCHAYFEARSVELSDYDEAQEDIDIDPILELW